MNVRYFCAPKLREFLSEIKFGMFDDLGESPAVRPLAVQTTYPGLNFDFNCGLRLQIPAGNWHVRILDLDSEIVCFDEDASDVVLISMEKFFVNWGFILWLDGELMFGHKFTPAGLKVHFYYMPSGMGDRIALFPYMEEFRKRWACNVSCTVEPYLQEIVKLYFPQVQCLNPPLAILTQLISCRRDSARCFMLMKFANFPWCSSANKSQGLPQRKSFTARRSRGKLPSLMFALPRKHQSLSRRG